VTDGRAIANSEREHEFTFAKNGMKLSLRYGRPYTLSGSLFLGDRLYKSSAVAEMGDRGHNRHGPKIGWGWACPVSRGSWVHIEHNVA